MNKYKNDILDNCISCNMCMRDCFLLQEIGPVKKLAGNEINEEISSACMACGLCESVCPKQLSPMKMLYQSRIKNVKGRENQIISLTSPDREKTSYHVYNEVYGVDYSDILISGKAKTVFFPGCVVSSYMPKLARTLFHLLKEKGLCEKMWLDCCTRNFTTYGCLERAESYGNKLMKFAKEHEIERIVTVCTNCHNSLKSVFQETGIEVVSVYSILDFKTVPDSLIYTVHDSCSDREANGLFSTKSREFLINNGFNVVEMKHSQKNSICCGRGGGAQHIRPEYSQKYVEMRLNEAKDVNADVIVVYCPLCGMTYLDNSFGIKVKHILEVMLDLDSELPDANDKSKLLFAGQLGKKRKEYLRNVKIINDVISDPL